MKKTTHHILDSIGLFDLDLACSDPTYILDLETLSYLSYLEKADADTVLFEQYDNKGSLIFFIQYWIYDDHWEIHSHHRSKDPIAIKMFKSLNQKIHRVFEYLFNFSFWGGGNWLIDLMWEFEVSFDIHDYTSEELEAYFKFRLNDYYTEVDLKHIYREQQINTLLEH